MSINLQRKSRNFSETFQNFPESRESFFLCFLISKTTEIQRLKHFEYDQIFFMKISNPKLKRQIEKTKMNPNKDDELKNEKRGRELNPKQKESQIIK